MSKILIMDDDSDFLQACETVLSREGYEVLTVSSVEEAEQVIEGGGLDLIMLDVMVVNPDDGISLAHRLQKNEINTPVIILSGVSRVTGYNYNCGEMLPCTDFIEKPVTPELLLKKVKNAMGK